jgi:MinD-like ATPase involved in chromosome partitioning or flagellar assembly
VAGTRKNGDSLEPSATSRTPTEDLTFTVSLPVPVHEAPEHEVALAIDEVAVTPEYLDAADTTTISLGTDAPVTTPTIADEDVVVIPALPESDDVYSRRTRLRGDTPSSPEPASMLTAERLIVPGRSNRKDAPEGFLQKLLYDATFHLVNVGDSYAVRARKALDARIARPLDGGTRFVPVLTRKGGVGKTTISTLLGMAMADVREDRVIAVDANPDRGTLAERVTKTTRATVRDVVSRSSSIRTFSEFQTLISRDETRLHVLASDTEPTVSSAFDDYDYNVVAGIAERFYSMVITDCGTGIVHPVMRATLERADSIVIVSGGSVDEARLASETLTWLESNGYADLVANAIVALNTGTQGTNLVKIEEIEAHFQSRVRDIVRIPYDPVLATGSIIHYKELKPFTREAARELAALVVDGLPERTAV